MFKKFILVAALFAAAPIAACCSSSNHAVLNPDLLVKIEPLISETYQKILTDMISRYKAVAGEIGDCSSMAEFAIAEEFFPIFEADGKTIEQFVKEEINDEGVQKFIGGIQIERDKIAQKLNDHRWKLELKQAKEILKAYQKLHGKLVSVQTHELTKDSFNQTYENDIEILENYLERAQSHQLESGKELADIFAQVQQLYYNCTEISDDNHYATTLRRVYKKYEEMVKKGTPINEIPGGLHKTDELNFEQGHQQEIEYVREFSWEQSKKDTLISYLNTVFQKVQAAQRAQAISAPASPSSLVASLSLGGGPVHSKPQEAAPAQSANSPSQAERKLSVAAVQRRGSTIERNASMVSNSLQVPSADEGKRKPSLSNVSSNSNNSMASHSSISQTQEEPKSLAKKAGAKKKTEPKIINVGKAKKPADLSSQAPKNPAKKAGTKKKAQPKIKTGGANGLGAPVQDAASTNASPRAGAKRTLAGLKPAAARARSPRGFANAAAAVAAAQQ